MTTPDRHKIIPAVWMIVKNDQNQIFLLRRANTGWRDGWWTVPAGHVEEGESPTHAAIRELREEVGITTTVNDLQSPLVYFYPADDGLHERVSIFFTVTNYTGTVTNQEPQKADQGEWFALEALPDTIIPMLRRALIDMSRGVVYSDRFYDAKHFKDLLS